jgi:hypothetical protein
MLKRSLGFQDFILEINYLKYSSIALCIVGIFKNIFFEGKFKNSPLNRIDIF